jgi:hypothetical protein
MVTRTIAAIIICDLRRRIRHFFITFAVAIDYMNVHFLIMQQMSSRNKRYNTLSGKYIFCSKKSDGDTVLDQFLTKTKQYLFHRNKTCSVFSNFFIYKQPNSYRQSTDGFTPAKRLLLSKHHFV